MHNRKEILAIVLQEPTIINKEETVQFMMHRHMYTKASHLQEMMTIELRVTSTTSLKLFTLPTRGLEKLSTWKIHT